MGTSVTLEIRRCIVLVFHFKDQGGYPVLKGRYPAYSTLKTGEIARDRKHETGGGFAKVGTCCNLFC